MKRRLKSIFIDGPRFSGKTSQSSVFASFLRASDIPFKKFKIDHFSDIQEIVNYIENSSEFVLIDGSINYYLCKELCEQGRREGIEASYNKYLNQLRQISSKGNILNVTLLPDEIEICQEFYNKSVKMGLTTEDFDQNSQYDILNCFRFIDNHALTRDIQFLKIDFYPKDTILNIHNAILKKIKEDYYLK